MIVYLRVTKCAVHTGHVPARILILPKISRFWLFVLCRLIVVNHESYKEQSRRLLMLLNRFYVYVRSFDLKDCGALCFCFFWICAQRRFKSIERTNTCAYLHSFDCSLQISPSHTQPHDWSTMYNTCMLLVKLLWMFKALLKFWLGRVPYERRIWHLL